MVSREQKWYFEIGPEMSLTDATREVLGASAATVTRYVERACTEGHDVEVVHQLRVATRRLGAALKMFRCVLPDKVHRRIRRANRRLRRTAGALRDLDVKVPILRERLASSAWLPRELKDQVCRVVDRLHARTVERFEDEIDEYGRRFLKQVSRLERELERRSKVRTEGPQNFGEQAREHLAARWQAFSKAGQKDLGDVEHLHQFRIHGKRYRYALEMTAGCVQREALEAVHQSLRELQGQLGQINDYRNLYTLLARLRSTVLRRFNEDRAARFDLPYDRLTAAIAFDWFNQHRAFVSRWTGAARTQLEVQVRRLTEPPPGGRDGKGRSRSIGFPISGSTITPIIAKKGES